MKKGQMISGKVMRVDYPNKGIVETPEGVCVVKNTLPGQRVTVMINKVKKGKPEGRLLTVDEPAAQEITAPCRHFGCCGGCTLLNLPYEEQLRLKGAQVRRLLEPVLAAHGRDGCWEGIKGSPQESAYRNKMEFTFGDEEKDGPLVLGLHRRNSFYDVVPVDECVIADEDYRRILRFCGDYFAAGGLDYYHRLKHEGYLRHLLVRKGARTGEILVALVSTSASDALRGDSSTLRGDSSILRGDSSTLRGDSSISRGDLSILRGYSSILRSDSSISRGDSNTSQGDSNTSQSASKAKENLKGEDWTKDFRGELEGDLAGESEEDLSDYLRGWQEGIMQLPLDGRVVGVLHIINDGVSDVVRSDKTEVLYGQDWFYEEILGMRFKISVFSFFQTNSLGAEVLYKTAREFIGAMGRAVKKTEKVTGKVPGKVTGKEELMRDENEEGGEQTEQSGYGSEEEGNQSAASVKPVIFDLYSGTGTIAQMMAPAASKVIGVEIVADAVSAARENAVLNGLDNCEFWVGDVLKVLDKIAEKPEYIIVDPPRDGLHPKVLQKVIEYGVERVLYISCKPTSLVRDLEGFVGAGYGVERVVAVDMFPGTVHVETVVLLERKG